MRMRFSKLTISLALLAAWAGQGCNRPSSPPPPASPLAVFRALVAARASGGYRAIEQYVLPQCAASVIDTLSAVDEFLAANARLCDYLRAESAPGVAAAVDLSRLADALEAFSRSVDPLSESIQDGEASVSFQVGGVLPLKYARFRRLNGQWKYDAGAGYDERLPAAFRRMARGMDIALDDFTSGRIPRSVLRDDPQRVLTEIRLRLLPGIQMLPAQLLPD